MEHSTTCRPGSEWKAVNSHQDVCSASRPNSLFLGNASNDSAWIWSFDWTLNHIADFEPSQSLSKCLPRHRHCTHRRSMDALPSRENAFATLCFGTLMQESIVVYFLSVCGSAAIVFGGQLCYHPRLMGSMLKSRRALTRRPNRRSRQHLVRSDPPDC